MELRIGLDKRILTVSETWQQYLQGLFNCRRFKTYQQSYGVDFVQELACFLLGPHWGKELVRYIFISLRTHSTVQSPS